MGCRVPVCPGASPALLIIDRRARLLLHLLFHLVRPATSVYRRIHSRFSSFLRRQTYGDHQPKFSREIGDHSREVRVRLVVQMLQRVCNVHSSAMCLLAVRSSPNIAEDALRAFLHMISGVPTFQARLRIREIRLRPRLPHRKCWPRDAVTLQLCDSPGAPQASDDRRFYGVYVGGIIALADGANVALFLRLRLRGSRISRLRGEPCCRVTLSVLRKVKRQGPVQCPKWRR
jgi:hypothetical protein